MRGTEDLGRPARQRLPAAHLPLPQRAIACSPGASGASGHGPACGYGPLPQLPAQRARVSGRGRVAAWSSGPASTRRDGRICPDPTPQTAGDHLPHAGLGPVAAQLPALATDPGPRHAAPRPDPALGRGPRGRRASPGQSPRSPLPLRRPERLRGSQPALHPQLALPGMDMIFPYADIPIYHARHFPRPDRPTLRLQIPAPRGRRTRPSGGAGDACRLQPGQPLEHLRLQRHQLQRRADEGGQGLP